MSICKFGANDDEYSCYAPLDTNKKNHSLAELIRAIPPDGVIYPGMINEGHTKRVIDYIKQLGRQELLVEQAAESARRQP